MDFKGMFTELNDYTTDYDVKDVESGKAMGILSYLSILSLIPYFSEKNNKYVRFHAIQGLNLFLINIIYSVVYGILSMILAFIPYIGMLLIFILSLIPYGFLVLYVWGIVNVCQNKAKEIPIVNKIKIIKE